MSVNRLALGDRLQTIERSVACTCHSGTLSGLLCFTTSSFYHSYSSIHLYFLPFLLSAILFSALITSISFVLCDHLYPPVFLSLCGYISASCDLRRAELHLWGRDSVDGIATSYGLEGPRIESWCGRDFPHPSRLALGPNHPPIQWVSGVFPGSKAAGVGVEERVELYFYSPSLASWPVLE